MCFFMLVVFAPGSIVSPLEIKCEKKQVIEKSELV